MFQWLILALTLILLGFLILFKPLWLVPLLGAAVALDISSTWYPDLGIVTKALGIASLTRFVSIALILAGFGRLLFSREMRLKFRAVFKNPLTIILLIYIVVGGASVVYSQAPGKTVLETVRLLVLFAVFVSTALLMDRDYTLLPFQAVHLSALLLAPLAFYEGFTGKLIWQAEQLLKEPVLRVNATFVDPNIFARYLVLAIAANFILQLYTREKGTRVFYLAVLPILLAELVMTSSRGGIITLAVVLLAALIMLPNRKAPLWVIGLGVLCGVIVLFGRPEIWERLLSVTQNFEVSNPQRLYLWKAAIAIFRDHPITGTGLGSFQTVFLKEYVHLRTVSDGATLSHTTVLTIASELGIIGLSVLVVLWIVLFRLVFQLYRRSDYYLNMFNNFNNKYYIGAGYFLWIITIFISSQGEGRFFEDPMFWLSAAVLVVLGFNRRFNVRLE